MAVSIFEPYLKKLDYRGIVESSFPLSNDTDRYIAVRALIILGHYDEAQKKLDGKLEGSLCDLARFLQIQLRLFRREDWQKCLEDLFALGPCIPNDPYLRGEYYFVLGYSHNLLDEYKQGSRYYQLAVQSYLSVDQQACASVALFNLSVSYDHLNAPTLLDQAFERLQQLAKELGLDSVNSRLFLFRSYRLIDKEEYSSALSDLKNVYGIYLREGRRREAGAAAWIILYVLLKLGNEEEFSRFDQELENIRAEFTPEYQRVICEIGSISRGGIFNSEKTAETLRSWKKNRIESIPELFLTDLLLERLLQSQEYEAMLKIAERAKLSITKRQMAVSLLDFRYYEAVALLKQGNISKGRRVLHAYHHDAIEAGSNVRAAKALNITSRFSASLTQAIAHPCSLILDLATHELVLGKRRIDLTSKPSVERLFNVLIREGKPVPLALLFYKVYQHPYSPWPHERRLNSLVDRARKVLGSSDLLLRREGNVELSPELTPLLKESSMTLESSIARRRQQLLQAIRSSKGPVKISDLEKVFDFSRRTLQFDLKHLLAGKQIVSSGGTRGRRYSSGEIR